MPPSRASGPTTRGVNADAAALLRPSSTPAPTPAPAPAPAPAPRRARAAPAPAAPPGPASVATTAAPSARAAPGLPDSPAAIEAEIRRRYAHMLWLVDIPEVRDKIVQSIQNGWTEDELRGAMFTTNWFKTHATTKITNDLKTLTDSYLVPMDDQSRQNWAMKIITKEVQPAEFLNWARTQAKSLFPHLSAAIDRGVTVQDYAASYKATAAQRLEIPPESIDLNDPKWRRALDGARDDKGQPMAMSLSEWERTIKTDATYGFDRTKQARQEAAQFASTLMAKFGRTG